MIILCMLSIGNIAWLWERAMYCDWQYMTGEIFSWVFCFYEVRIGSYCAKSIRYYLHTVARLLEVLRASIAGIADLCK